MRHRTLSSPPAASCSCRASPCCCARCTLIQRPEPVTTLQLQLVDADLAWPAALLPGKVESVSALRSNRVLVVDGAVLMQHDGLRWIDTPAVMPSEQLRAVHARDEGAHTANASLDLWLTEFNLRVDADRSNTAVTTAHATLRCHGSDQTLVIAPVSSDAKPASNDPQALADAFARASRDLVSALLKQSSERAPGNVFCCLSSKIGAKLPSLS